MAVDLPPFTASLPLLTTPLTAATPLFCNTPVPDATAVQPYLKTTAGPAGLAGSDMSIHARGVGLSVLPYAVLYSFWLLVMGAGLIGIWLNRKKKAIRIRDWRSITIAVVAIYLLFTTCLTATWIPQQITCQAVYWIVSLLFPACLAAFQIPNARLVSYYLANKDSGINRRMSIKGHGLWRYWARMTVIERTYLTVMVGLLLQIIFTTLMFFGSRRFHARYGLWGHSEDWQRCMFGFEWVVSVAWQMIWAYGTGVFLLMEIRHVKDVYHWALETRIAIFASMPGPLLWMIFMFADSSTVRAINQNWPPRNWLMPGLAVVQFVLTSFPLWEACKSEVKQEAALRHNSTYGLGSSIDNMINVIDYHSEPLVNYAASTRFNAELIIFLRDVRKWRTGWTTQGADWAVPSTRAERVACYKHAALIYFKLVHPTIATFAINIEAKTRSSLADQFKYARYVGGSKPAPSRREIIAPWSSAEALSRVASIRRSPLAMKGLEITLVEAEKSIMLISPETLDATHNNVDDATTEGIHLASYAHQDVPDTFKLSAFDRAYKEVKQETYYNVWLPYFKAGLYRQDLTASTDIV